MYIYSINRALKKSDITSRRYLNPKVIEPIFMSNSFVAGTLYTEDISKYRIWTITALVGLIPWRTDWIKYKQFV